MWSGDAASAAFENILNKSSVVHPGCREVAVGMRCSCLIRFCLSLRLSYRAKPNSEDVLSKRISFPETELPESQLCKVASPKLPKNIPYLWRHVFNYPAMQDTFIRLGKVAVGLVKCFVKYIDKSCDRVNYTFYPIILKIPECFNGTNMTLYSIENTDLRPIHPRRQILNIQQSYAKQCCTRCLPVKL